MERNPSITTLREEVDRVLGPLVAGARRVALLDYPNFPNVGDSAIWLGQNAWLRRAGLRRVYSAERMLSARNVACAAHWGTGSSSSAVEAISAIFGRTISASGSR